MDWWFLLLDFVPLIVFVVVDSVSNMRYAVISAVIAAAIEIIISLILFGEIDEFALVSVGLILFFGGLSLHFNNSLYFKFKPVVMGVILAVVFFVTFAMNKPLLIVALDRYVTFFPLEMQRIITRPEIQAAFHRMSLTLGFGLLIHAGIVGWTAIRLSNWWWLAARSVGLYVMMFLVVLLSL